MRKDNTSNQVASPLKDPPIPVAEEAAPLAKDLAVSDVEPIAPPVAEEDEEVHEQLLLSLMMKVCTLTMGLKTMDCLHHQY